MPRLVLSTPLGDVALQLLADAAPATAAHVARLARAGVYDGASFYRSDFVIQMGLHGTTAALPPSFPPLTVNESARAGHLSNVRGAAALAHWDVPDCGGTELFISLKANAHLDAAYGGFCVFAAVAAGDAASFATIDAIAKAVAGGAKPVVTAAEIVSHA